MTAGPRDSAVHPDVNADWIQMKPDFLIWLCDWWMVSAGDEQEPPELSGILFPVFIRNVSCDELLPLGDSVVSQLYGSPRASCTKSFRSGIGSAWRVHRDEAFGVQSPAADRRRHLSCCDVRRSSFQPADPLRRPAGTGPFSPRRYNLMSRCEVDGRESMSRCRVCHSGLLLEQRLNQSPPSIYGSVRIDGEDELDSEKEAGPSTSVLSHPFYPNVSDYLQPGLPRNLHSPRIHTAPPSPLPPRRRLEENLVELAKQESLDELRTTVQLAASSMESSTKDIRVLGEKMAAATELMTETVQSLVLLTQGVDRLQMFLTSSRTQINTVKPSDAEQPLHQDSRCSSSCSSSLDAPSTSQTVHHLSSFSHEPPHTSVKTKSAPQQQKKLETSKDPLTNGLLAELKEGRSNQRKKKKKKPR